MEFYTAKDIVGLTGNSMCWARKTLQMLNNRLKDQGYLTIKGRVPKKLFEEAFGIKIGKEELSRTQERESGKFEII